jgi:hypothetical protein
MSTNQTPPLTETTTTPPAPVPPPHLVRLRVDVDGGEYRLLRHLSIETSTSVNDMAAEAIRMLLRWYAAQGLPTTRHLASEGSTK